VLSPDFLYCKDARKELEALIEEHEKFEKMEKTILSEIRSQQEASERSVAHQNRKACR
jgi:hypothetical protein